MKKVLIYLLLFGFVMCLFAGKPKVIIDADTGNEMDDLYAVVRALIEPSIDVVGLTSCHFNNVQLVTDKKWHIYPTKDINTVQISQDLNEEILSYLRMEELAHPLGCDRMIGYAWGFYPGAPIPDSDATQFIINEAKKASPETKLIVVTLGAVTNVAAAILLEPEIVPNIKLLALTMKYDTEKKAWDKNSFNARNDHNGLDVILNNKDLELWVIPGNVSRQMQFKRKPTLKKLFKNNTPLDKMLARRWDEVNAEDSWIMWDLALIEALIHPEMAEVSELMTPPENTQRKIKVYTSIDVERMKKDFWKSYFTMIQ